jgi:hypothetical protein
MPNDSTPQFIYVWEMPNAETFRIPAIRSLVKLHLSRSQVSVDFFARDNRWATFTNDLNPDTRAEFHLEAEAFAELMIARDVRADLLLFDPPYSLRQIKECYEGIGQDMPHSRTQGWHKVKDLAARIVVSGGIAISFGWNSNGFGIERGFRKETIMLVSHGGAHNDTIITVERKVSTMQGQLFSSHA